MADKPSVLFVCVHNAGRSQMAAGYLNHFAGDRIEVRSAGSEPADKINPVAAQAMAEEGIDIAAEQPKILTTEAVKASDVVITMGCGDTCPYLPRQALRGLGSRRPCGPRHRARAAYPRRNQKSGRAADQRTATDRRAPLGRARQLGWSSLRPRARARTSTSVNATWVRSWRWPLRVGYRRTPQPAIPRYRGRGLPLLGQAPDGPLALHRSSTSTHSPSHPQLSW